MARNLRQRAAVGPDFEGAPLGGVAAFLGVDYRFVIHVIVVRVGCHFEGAELSPAAGTAVTQQTRESPHDRGTRQAPPDSACPQGAPMMFSTFSTQHRPYPLVTAADSNGVGRRSKGRPQLSARWVVAEDGRLSCVWTAA